MGKKRAVEEVIEEDIEEPTTEKKKKKKKEKAEPVEEVEEPTTEKKKKKKKEAVEEEEEPKTDKKKKKKDKKNKVEEEEEEAPKKKEAEEEDGEPGTACVKSLPWSVDEAQLKKDFGACGQVDEVRLLKTEDGSSRGIAFVQFASKAAMKKACEWNETDYEGRTIYVSDANEGGKGGKGKGKGKGPQTKPEGCTSVVIRSLHQDILEDDLWTLFEDCSSASRMKLLTDWETGASKGMAFADFEDTDDVDKAVKKTGTKLNGQEISVSFNIPREKGGGKGKGGKGKGKKSW